MAFFFGEHPLVLGLLIKLINKANISRKVKVGGMPGSRAGGFSHHDGLKEKSHRDIGSNPIHDFSSEGLHSIEV